MRQNRFVYNKQIVQHPRIPLKKNNQKSHTTSDNIALIH